MHLGGRRREDSAVQTSAHLRAAAAPPDRTRRAARWRLHRGHHRRSEVNRLSFDHQGGRMKNNCFLKFSVKVVYPVASHLLSLLIKHYIFPNYRCFVR